MTAIAFDTLAYAKRMKEVGFTEQQAEAQAEGIASIIDDQLTTKKDLELLRVDLKKDIALVKKDIETIKKDILLKLGGMIIGAFLANITILGFLIRMGH